MFSSKIYITYGETPSSIAPERWSAGEMLSTFCVEVPCYLYSDEALTKFIATHNVKFTGLEAHQCSIPSVYALVMAHFDSSNHIK